MELEGESHVAAGVGAGPEPDGGDWQFQQSKKKRPTYMERAWLARQGMIPERLRHGGRSGKARRVGGSGCKIWERRIRSPVTGVSKWSMNSGAVLPIKASALRRLP